MYSSRALRRLPPSSYPSTCHRHDGDDHRELHAVELLLVPSSLIEAHRQVAEFHGAVPGKVCTFVCAIFFLLPRLLV